MKKQFFRPRTMAALLALYCLSFSAAAVCAGTACAAVPESAYADGGLISVREVPAEDAGYNSGEDDGYASSEDDGYASGTDSGYDSGEDAGTESASHVMDRAGLLTGTERDSLESLAAEIAASYAFDVYLATVDDYRDYGNGDVYDVAVSLYEAYGLGYGAGQDGEFLLISMDGRDYALMYHGFGNSAFSDYGRDLVEDSFLDNFRDNDWYGGFWDYLEMSAYVVEQARNGDILRPDSGTYDEETGDYNGPASDYNGGAGGLDLFDLLLLVLVPCAVSGFICYALYSAMRSVRHAAYAGTYAAGGPILRIATDTYTHTTESRVKIKEESHDSGGGGSVSHSGGGSSGRSGNF